jgi:arsenite methyltransferase
MSNYRNLKGGIMDTKNAEEIRQAVRNRYGDIAGGKAHLFQENDSACCGGQPSVPNQIAADIGYSKEEIESVPESANMGLGCGNPTAIASIKPGDTVLDLGSGGGFDCFLAAKAAGDTGKVIGVDMTPEMVSKARIAAQKAGANNIEFRLGEIEHLPVADESIDIIISNCVINLSPNKQQVFQESFRVLKGGGRLAVSDVIATASLPKEVQNDLALIGACIGGAQTIDTIEKMLKNAGFEDIRVQPKDKSREIIKKWLPDKKIEDYVLSATILAKKPD